MREHAPPLSGSYGISNAIEWIYIGETDNLQEILLWHLQDLNTALLKRQPTGFVFLRFVMWQNVPFVRIASFSNMRRPVIAIDSSTDD